MKFYNRKRELEVLHRHLKQSKKNAYFTIMLGRRRIGKTCLLLESVKDQRYLYLFVARQCESLLCAQFQKEATEILGIQLSHPMTNFKDLFEQLLIFATKEHYTLIIDEFQEFDTINSSIFRDIKDLWDQYKNKAKINLIACGSVYSSMMKIFANKKEPLFGRYTSKIVLKPFPISTLKDILTDYNPGYHPEDLLCLYMLTGGMPKYIDLLMEGGAVTKNKMLDKVAGPDSPFIVEGKDLLISEFGREYGIYFSILHLIASGKNTQSEIDAVINKNTGAYLVNLEKEYVVITKSKPIFSKPESRKARWSLNDNFLSFWFRFFYPNQSFIETGRHAQLREYIGKQYESYSSIMLQKYFREKIMEDEQLTYIGSHWDKKGENEIDIIALNDFDKTAIVADVRRNPKKMNMYSLIKKASSIKKELAKYDVSLKGLSLGDM